MNAKDLAKVIVKAIEDKKGVDIKVIDVREISSICDVAIIATAESEPQLRALQRGVEQAVHDADKKSTCKISGDSESAWIVIDFFDVMVHLFLDEARKFYDLEGMLQSGKPIDDIIAAKKPAAKRLAPRKAAADDAAAKKAAPQKSAGKKAAAKKPATKKPSAKSAASKRSGAKKPAAKKPAAKKPEAKKTTAKNAAAK